MHVTAAMDVKQVAIFGPTSTVKNKPWSKKAVVITKGLDCQPCQYGTKASTCTRNQCMDIEPVEIVGHVKNLIEQFAE
jgi:ADP-heptose:LPS heptosyltransferase